jgi:1,4-dihydroxy-2-naphthoate octaprenyltransferase
MCITCDLPPPNDTNARTLISGGAGVGAAGTLSSPALRRAAIVAGCLGLGLATAIGSTPLAAVWLLAALLVWAYDGNMLRLSRHPLGAACQAIGVGIVRPLLGAWLVAPPAWPVGQDIVVGLCLGFSGHVLTALPDEEADRKVGKATVVVRFGATASLILLLIGFAIAGVLLFGVMQPCTAGLAILLWLTWHLRGRPAPGGLSFDLWLAAVIALMLWVVWIVQ